MAHWYNGKHKVGTQKQRRDMQQKKREVLFPKFCGWYNSSEEKALYKSRSLSRKIQNTRMWNRRKEMAPYMEAAKEERKRQKEERRLKALGLYESPEEKKIREDEEKAAAEAEANQNKWKFV